jgi:hypothetical protein
VRERSPVELKAGDRVRVRPTRGDQIPRSGVIIAVVFTAGSSLPFYKVRWSDGLEGLTPFAPDVEVEVEEPASGPE